MIAFVFFLIMPFHQVFGNMVQLEKSILDKLLRGYDATLRPNMIGSTDSPTEVKVNMFITDLFEVNDKKMDYSMQLYFKQTWLDPRLRYPDPEGIVKSIPVNPSGLIWTPDLFFNEREGKFHNIQKANKLIRIYPNGKVFFSTRLTLKLRCPMDFKYFPFDKQICEFDLESYGSDTRDIELKWAEGHPIQINAELKIPNFVLENFYADYCDNEAQGGYSCLTVKLQMKRQYGFYLTQLFIPYVIMVAISWLSFWLDPKAVTLRLSLLLVLIFIMVTLISGVHSLLPSVSYTKAIDIWTAVSLSLVFGTFLEFILVNQLARRELRVRIQKNHLSENGGCTQTEFQKSTTVKTLWKKHITQHIPPSKRIDFACRILFPLMFVIFNCVFWLTYIKGRESQALII